MLGVMDVVLMYELWMNLKRQSKKSHEGAEN